jgi:spore coat polysaccharide biosynthesis protein SpsF
MCKWVPIVIQARLSSRRLPGKVLLPLGGRPLISWMLYRLAFSRHGGDVVIATSDQSSDDQLAAFCAEQGVKCHRGPLDDVTKRFLAAGEAIGASAVVRLCGDSPFIDPAIVDWAISEFLSAPCDLVSNIVRRTYPHGQSVEVIKLTALAEAYPEMDGEEREHVTRFFYRHPERFDIRAFESGAKWGDIQMAVDSSDDFNLATRMADRLAAEKEDCGLESLVGIHAKLMAEAM